MSRLLIILIYLIRISYSQECSTKYMNLNRQVFSDEDHKKLCSDKICVQKCCGLEERVFYYDPINGNRCLGKGNNTKYGPLDYSDIPIYKNDIENGVVLSDKRFGLYTNDSDFTLIFNWVLRPNNGNCTNPAEIFELHDSKDTFILEDGSLATINPHRYHMWQIYPNANYCIEYMLVPSNDNSEMQIKLTYKTLKNLNVINRLKQYENSNALVIVAMCLSIVLLITVLVVYILLPDLRNMGGKVMMSYVCSLILYLTMRVSHIIALDSPIGDSNAIISAVAYFTYFATFFWMNVVSFDIWWTLRGNVKFVQIHKKGENVKLVRYSLYGWGMPLIMTSITAGIDFGDVPAYVMKIRFSDGLLPSIESRFYMQLPMIILILINCVLFAMTVRYIHKVQKGIDRFGNRPTLRYRFIIYLKLSSIMGISWLLDLTIAFIQDAPFWLEIVVDVYNLFIGVPIFLTLVLKRVIILKLCKKYDIKNDFVMKIEKSLNNSQERSMANPDSEQSSKFNESQRSRL